MANTFHGAPQEAGYAKLICELAELCRLSGASYAKAVTVVQDPSLKGLLAACAKRRRQAFANLQAQLATRAVSQSKGTDSDSPERVFPARLESGLMRDDQAVLNACKECETLIMEAYDDALERQLPPELHEVLRRQRVELDRVRTYLDKLTTRLHRSAKAFDSTSEPLQHRDR